MISNARKHAGDDGRIRWTVGYRHLIALTAAVLIGAIGYSLPDAKDYIPAKQSAYLVVAFIAAISIYALRRSSHRNRSALVICLLLCGTIATNLYNLPSLPGRSTLRLADFAVKSNDERALYWLRDRMKAKVVLTEPGVIIPDMLRQYARVPKIREIRKTDMVDARVDASAELAIVLQLPSDMKLEVYLVPKPRQYLLRTKQGALGISQLIPLRPLE